MLIVKTYKSGWYLVTFVALVFVSVMGTVAYSILRSSSQEYVYASSDGGENTKFEACRSARVSGEIASTPVQAQIDVLNTEMNNIGKEAVDRGYTGPYPYMSNPALKARYEALAQQWLVLTKQAETIKARYHC